MEVGAVRAKEGAVDVVVVEYNCRGAFRGRGWKKRTLWWRWGGVFESEISRRRGVRRDVFEIETSLLLAQRFHRALPGGIGSGYQLRHISPGQLSIVG